MPNLFQVEPPMNPSPSTDNVIANTELFKETVGWTCKNEFNPINIKSGYAIFGDSQGAYINTSTNGLTYVAQIKTDTDYTISRKNGIGNEFVIALFTTQPTIPNTTPETNSEVIIDDSTYDTYTFNSDDYQWVAFTVNDTTGDPSTLVTTVEAMLCKAEILDGSYEAHHDSVDAVKQNKQLSSAITVNGTSYSQVESALNAINNFIGLMNAPFTQQGITITDDRITILSGGYKLIGNMCYVQMRIKVEGTSQGYSYNFSIMRGFPPVNSTNFYTGVQLNVSTQTGSQMEKIGAKMESNYLSLALPSDSLVGDPTYLVISGWYDTQ